MDTTTLVGHARTHALESATRDDDDDDEYDG
jgi:hypothetical protein